MALTFTPIQKVLLTSTQSTVQFSSIPTTYRDLIVYVKGRLTAATTYSYIYMTVNGTSQTGSSSQVFYGAGGNTTPSNYQDYPVNFGTGGYINADSLTANYFGGGYIYIPSYRNSLWKLMFGNISASAGNTQGWTNLSGSILNTTSAINSLEITAVSGAFAINSRFDLYGISNTV